MKIMNRDERVVSNYLEGEFEQVPAYEPDGNCPPDFAIGASLAVEVRRLNEHSFHGAVPVGLEQLDNVIWSALTEAVTPYVERGATKSYWAFVECQRPFLGRRRRLKSEFRRAIDDFLGGSRLVPVKILVVEGVTLEFVQAGIDHSQVVKAAGLDNLESGGLVSRIYADNISHCITEKTHKVRPFLHRYSEWWLVLVDRLYYRFPSHEVDSILTLTGSVGPFAQVVVLDPEGARTLSFLPEGSD